jgi:hypothetical protein
MLDDGNTTEPQSVRVAALEESPLPRVELLTAGEGISGGRPVVRCPSELRTLQNLVARKELPARRIGRRVLIHSRDLVSFARHDHFWSGADGC